MISYHIFATKKIQINKLHECFACIVFIITLSVIWQINISNIEYLILVPCVAFSLMIIAFLDNSPVVDFFETKILKWLGKYSFTIYLTHIPVCYLFLGFKTSNLSQNIVLSVIVMSITIFIAPFIYINIEKRFIDYSKKLIKKNVFQN